MISIRAKKISETHAIDGRLVAAGSGVGEYYIRECDRRVRQMYNINYNITQSLTRYYITSGAEKFPEKNTGTVTLKERSTQRTHIIIPICASGISTAAVTHFSLFFFTSPSMRLSSSYHRVSFVFRADSFLSTAAMVEEK